MGFVVFEVEVAEFGPEFRVVGFGREEDRADARLEEGIAEPGEHAVTWNARGERSGVYLVEMNAGGYRAVRKLLLVK